MVTVAQWFDLAKQGGAVLVPFLLGALFWMAADRNRVIADNKLKDERLLELSKQWTVVWTEMRAYLFHERKS